MKINLISTMPLEDSDCFSTFAKMWWKITKGALVIEKRYRIGTLYICPHNIDYFISVDSAETSTVLWHHRLGHISE